MANQQFGKISSRKTESSEKIKDGSRVQAVAPLILPVNDSLTIPPSLFLLPARSAPSESVTNQLIAPRFFFFLLHLLIRFNNLSTVSNTKRPTEAENSLKFVCYPANPDWPIRPIRSLPWSTGSSDATWWQPGESRSVFRFKEISVWLNPDSNLPDRNFEVSFFL